MTRYKKSMFDATMEVLKPSMGAGAYIKDFRKSDAPQFKGKSEKEQKEEREERRKKMVLRRRTNTESYKKASKKKTDNR